MISSCSSSKLLLVSFNLPLTEDMTSVVDTASQHDSSLYEAGTRQATFRGNASFIKSESIHVNLQSEIMFVFGSGGLFCSQ